MRRRVVVGGLMALWAAGNAWGYLFMQAAVAEALVKAHSWIKDHPGRAEGYYFLARINGSAWAKGTAGKGTEVQIATFGDANSPPRFVPWDSLMYERKAEAPVTDEAQRYIAQSLEAYKKAVELDKNNAVYHLGLAWAMEEAGKGDLAPLPEMMGKEKLTAQERKGCEEAMGKLGDGDFAAREAGTKALAALMPRSSEFLLAAKSDDAETKARIHSILQGFWQAEAVKEYREAFVLSAEKDLAAQKYDAEGDATVSVRAGERLLAIPPGAAMAEAQQFARTLEVIKAKPGELHSY